MLKPTDTDSDRLQVFYLNNAPVRGRFVRLEHSIEKIIGFRAYPPVIRKVLGEALALTCTLASFLKYDGLFTLQINGNGLMPMLVCDIISHEAENGGGLRGYARYEETIPANATLKDLVGKGYLSFTVHKGSLSKPYQGIIPLEKETLAACIMDYFAHSEQIPAYVHLVHDQGKSAALVLQKMPEAAAANDEPEDWNRATILAETLTDKEMLDSTLKPTELLYRLFHEEGVMLEDQRPITVSCRCDNEKFMQVLSSIPKGELASVAEDGKVSINCEFCNYTYVADV